VDSGNICFFEMYQKDEMRHKKQKEREKVLFVSHLLMCVIISAVGGMTGHC
jgi:hypothetical protein